MSHNPHSYKALQDLSAKATPGEWKVRDLKRVEHLGLKGPLMSYLVGDRRTFEGETVSIGSERVADHEFVAALVNAFRAGELVAQSQPESSPEQKSAEVTHAMIEAGKDERMACFKEPALMVGDALRRIYLAMEKARLPATHNETRKA